MCQAGVDKCLEAPLGSCAELSKRETYAFHHNASKTVGYKNNGSSFGLKIMIS